MILSDRTRVYAGGNKRPMNNNGKKTEQDLLSALADAVEDSVLGAEGPARTDLSRALSAGEDPAPARKRSLDLSGLSLDDEPREKTQEELAAEARARRAAFEELAADPKLKALDQRAAEEEAKLHGHHHHHHSEPKPAEVPAQEPVSEAEKDEAPAEPEAPAAEEELIPAAPAPVPPDRQEVAEAEELLSSEAFAEDSVSAEELVSFILDESPAEPSKAAAEPAPEVEAILEAPAEAETPAPEAEEQPAPAPEAPAEKAEPEAPAKAEAAAPVQEASAEAPKAEKSTPAPAAEVKSASHPAEKKPRSKLGKVLTSTLCILLETILLIAVALYGVMFLLARGPSGTASRLFVRSVRETSAIGFLANLYFSEEEIQALMSAPGEAEYVATDTNLISMTSVPEDTAKPDAWGFVDEDGDGIILDPVKGEGYSGYMMIVLDPSRVILGSNPSTYGSRGYTVEEFVQMYDAVAGINGGAFQDENGMGTGAYPEGLVVYEGQTYNWGVKQGFAGIDDKYILHVGCQSLEDAVAANIQYGASYGPVLVQNGQMTSDDTLESGLNPRTAIGQRSDGAFLLLVIDGRQVISLGATYLDEAEIMLRYGAVNAINLDGGSSSMMYYNGAYVNNSASVVGIRPIPTSFVVLKEGRG